MGCVCVSDETPPVLRLLLGFLLSADEAQAGQVIRHHSRLIAVMSESFTAQDSVKDFSIPLFTETHRKGGALAKPQEANQLKLPQEANC